ncbi:unnamed protein product, partial [Oppiella nova]
AIELIGSGSFGEVYKARHKYTTKSYAIKITELRPAAIKELQMLAQSIYVVKLESFWSENDNIFIQMEYCHENLKNMLDIRHAAFNREQSELMSTIEYYMFSQLFLELIEAVNYLNKMNLAVIHRDIYYYYTIVLFRDVLLSLVILDFQRIMQVAKNIRRVLVPRLILPMKFI